MSDTTRGVSTVADVALALLCLAAAMALLVAFVGSETSDHDARETEYTTETLLSSTVDTTYHVERALADARGFAGTRTIYDETEYDREDLRRISHGPVVAQVADVAVTNVEFYDDEFSEGRLTRAAHEHRQRLDEVVQSRLVASSFETHITATWEPFEDGVSWVRGTTEIGQQPPNYEDVSSTTVTVPSDIPSVREDAIAAVDDPDDFDVVAELVATALVEGYFPVVESQRALESTGVERELVVSRYQTMAAILEPDPDLLHEDESFEEQLARSTANASRANSILLEELTAQFERFLEPNPAVPPANQPLGDALSAAEQIRTGEVTVTVRTWT